MLEGAEFHWYYNPVKSSIEDDENFQLTHDLTQKFIKYIQES